MSSKTPKTLTGMMARAVGMKVYVPKTGLAKLMRAWMIAQGQRKFTATELLDGLGIPHGKEREKVASRIWDFVDRGELERIPEKRKRRQNVWRYRYNGGWKKAVHMPIADKIYKAMYVSGTFTGPEIRMLAEVEETGYVLRLIKELLESDMIQVVSRRLCAHGAGAERQYHIPNRDRFRLEVMK